MTSVLEVISVKFLTVVLLGQAPGMEFRPVPQGPQVPPPPARAYYPQQQPQQQFFTPQTLPLAGPQVPSYYSVPAQPGVPMIPVPPPPAPGVLLTPVVPVIAAPPPLTFGQATTALKGLRAGNYRMWFIHPVTNQPVCTSFNIARGCVLDVDANRWFGNYRLVLKVPGVGNDVALKFKKDGRLVVAE